METKVKKNKTWKYHTSHSYVVVKTNETVSLLTQLYQTIGVYGIINNDPALQFGCKPYDLVRVEKKLKKDLSNGEIRDLEFGREMCVTEDENGFYVEK